MLLYLFDYWIWIFLAYKVVSAGFSSCSWYSCTDDGNHFFPPPGIILRKKKYEVDFM